MKKRVLKKKDAEFMDELITLKEKYLREQREQNERVKKLLQEKKNKESSCLTMGGRIKNILLGIYNKMNTI